MRADLEAASQERLHRVLQLRRHNGGGHLEGTLEAEARCHHAEERIDVRRSRFGHNLFKDRHCLRQIAQGLAPSEEGLRTLRGQPTQSMRNGCAIEQRTEE